MATNTLRRDRKTPGVYVTEFSAFPPSVVGVETAVPIFIGYTETAHDPSTNQQVYLKAIPIDSMADYYDYFGQGYDAKGVVVEAVIDTETGEFTSAYDFQAASTNGTSTDGVPESVNKAYIVKTSTGEGSTSSFNLYSALQLFYGNGGGNCFVVSVANYWGTMAVDPPPALPITNPTTIDPDLLRQGLAVARETRGPTMIVVPDACMLVQLPDPTDPNSTITYDGYGDVAVDMLNQAGELQDRVAILDMPGALVPANWSPLAMLDEKDALSTAINPASANFSYGCCYGPAVQSSLLDIDDVDYTNLNASDDSVMLMNNLLTTQALSLYKTKYEGDGKQIYKPTFVQVAANIAAAFPITKDVTPIANANYPGVTGTVAEGTLQVSVYDPDLDDYVETPTDAAGIQTLDQYLTNAVPLLGKIQQLLVDKLNVVPPSGIMAGIWAQNDATRGVWNAPANMALNQVVKPMVLLSDEDQGAFNMPLDGNAIDILRAMVNRGTVVWGARTLLGNSLDYRYIQVRRTLNYIEQSIKLALQQFVFAANDGGTWAVVTATISNFLTQLWQSGGLMGDKASEAFTVKCGVPTTMSGLDVLNGYMIVNVTVQMIHPAEFIELTFTQTMQGV